MIPLSVDFLDKLLNIDASTRERWILRCIEAGEFEAAEEIRQSIERELELEVAA